MVPARPLPDQRRQGPTVDVVEVVEVVEVVVVVGGTVVVVVGGTVVVVVGGTVVVVVVVGVGEGGTKVNMP